MIMEEAIAIAKKYSEENLPKCCILKFFLHAHHVEMDLDQDYWTVAFDVRAADDEFLEIPPCVVKIYAKSKKAEFVEAYW